MKAVMARVLCKVHVMSTGLDHCEPGAAVVSNQTLTSVVRDTGVIGITERRRRMVYTRQVFFLFHH